MSLLLNRLAKRPVTFLTGARQIGKTTPVRDLLPVVGGPAGIYSSLDDDPEERLRLGPIKCDGSITARPPSSTSCSAGSPGSPHPPALHFFRTHAGREVDVVLHVGDRLLAIEVKAGRHAHRTDARPFTEVLGAINVRRLARNA